MNMVVISSFILGIFGKAQKNKFYLIFPDEILFSDHRSRKIVKWNIDKRPRSSSAEVNKLPSSDVDVQISELIFSLTFQPSPIAGKVSFVLPFAAKIMSMIR